MLDNLQKLVQFVIHNEYLNQIVQYEVLTNIEYEDNLYPIYSFKIGSSRPEDPVYFITGGIHGLERIGSQLAWSLLKTTLDRLIWDKSLQSMLSTMRLVFIPLLNPVGYYHFKRSNGNDVDLMRNSPINSNEKVPFLLGGQTYTKILPWYRGNPNKLEKENLALYQSFLQHCLKSSCVISIDFHSGFGMKDRIWFPFSYTKKPFDKLSEMCALDELFDETHPYHVYQVEPQSSGYLLSGDIWDYIYQEFMIYNPKSIFIPLTLEMGSWSWVRKNPLQIFSRQGIFNPTKTHRLKRTYRRHHLLFEFLMKATYSNSNWSQLDDHLKAEYFKKAIRKWYE